jgi:hypothetical protein
MKSAITLETHFWHERPPFQTKIDIEKLTGILLERDPKNTEKLVYRGSSTLGRTHELELRFEAVLPRAPYVMRPPTERREFKNLYLLRLVTNASEKDANRAFEYWSLRLQCCQRVTDFRDHSQSFYDDHVRESIEHEEAERRRVEDPDPIIALQKKVLAALEDGKQFRTAHKEGGTILFFNGRNFVREDYGDDPNIKEFVTREEMIACIRNFYDWDSRKETYPHRPPELEVWKFIQRQLR